ncbi:MAG: hypothetical protein IBX45_08300 [Campylobacterales bacterium]|nr:hypothetical protein [Campylobacterales bacterium]
MPILLCASKYHILSHWTQNLDKTPRVAKSQKELLTLLAKEHNTVPLVLLEAKLYEVGLAEIVGAMREANPAVAVMLLSPCPTFHGGQEILALGANGYGNVYLSKAWLDDVIDTLKKGENWLFPLQEETRVLGEIVGEVSALEGELFGNEGRMLGVGSPVYAQETLMLAQSTTRASLSFVQGPTLSLKGMEYLVLDESVFSQSPHTPLCLARELPRTAHPFTSLSERPFYVNVGKESLIDAHSSELMFEGILPHHIAVFPFEIEEAVEVEEVAGLTFGTSEVQEFEQRPDVMRLHGRVEEYEIIYSKSFSQCVFVNDSVAHRDGARIVYPPIQRLAFVNAKVDLFHAPTPVASLKTKQFGSFLDWTHCAEEALKRVSIVVRGYTQGVDYVLFDRACIPAGVRFNYGMDETHISIHFFGEAPVKAYQTLLGSVRHEANGISHGTLRAKVEASGATTSWVLFEGLVDT